MAAWKPHAETDVPRHHGSPIDGPLKPFRLSHQYRIAEFKEAINWAGGGRCHNLKNGAEASAVPAAGNPAGCAGKVIGLPLCRAGKSSRMRWECNWADIMS